MVVEAQPAFRRRRLDESLSLPDEFLPPLLVAHEPLLFRILEMGHEVDDQVVGGFLIRRGLASDIPKVVCIDQNIVPGCHSLRMPDFKHLREAVENIFVQRFLFEPGKLGFYVAEFDMHCSVV